jgi:hypothetical protein
MLPLSWVTSMAEIARNADDVIGTTRQRSVNNQVSWDCVFSNDALLTAARPGCDTRSVLFYDAIPTAKSVWFRLHMKWYYKLGEKSKARGRRNTLELIICILRV